MTPQQSEFQPNMASLCRVATLSNSLAHQLTGRARVLAFKIKAEACSSLILNGGAVVNGVWPTGIVALDLLSDPVARVHVPRAHLSPAARVAVIRQASTAPAVSRMAHSCRLRTVPESTGRNE